MNQRQGHVLLAAGLGVLVLLGMVGALGAMGEDTLSAQANPERAAAVTVTETLMTLYYSTDGANWYDSTGWGTSVSYCDWYGVDCDDEGEVIELDLHSNRLSGTIPADLEALGSLQTLALWSNFLSGPIPPQLGNLTGLRRLSLYNNGLGGTIPAKLAALSNLTELRLDANSLDGPIPPQLGNLGGLLKLYLSNNSLIGPVPPELGTMKSLEVLALGGNDLSGPIPTELAALSNLQALGLARNNLSGPIPPELGKLSSLRDLTLNSNNLRGPIPAELGELSSLRDLYLSSNNLSGPIPHALTNLPILDELSLGNNPYLTCWETEEALIWGRSSDEYFGPYAVCVCVDREAIAEIDGGPCWADAFTDLQSALAVTHTLGSATTEIWVAEGVYHPDEAHTDWVTATFTLADGVALYGGFDPGSGVVTLEDRDPAAYVTVLSGDLAGDDEADANGVVTTTTSISGSNAWTVVTAVGVDYTAILDGFTITAGNADGADCGDGEPCKSGGGLYNYQSSPVLARLHFSGNRAVSYGGGIYNSLGSPRLSRVAFSGNSAILGGGMINDSGSPELSHAVFGGNWAEQDGGGMANYRDSTPSLVNVIFADNSAQISGGGMLNFWGSSSALVNVSFSGNLADTGDGMVNLESSPSLVNCILWGNGSGTATEQIFNDTSAPMVNHSLVQGGCPAGSTCDNLLTENPSFVNAAGGDLRLGPGSPAIDKGNNDDVPEGITTDLAGRPRIINGIVDMGAYETPLSVFLPLVLRVAP